MSRATPYGLFSVADEAGPPSPLNELVPIPTMVVMMPVDTVTLRMALLPDAAMYTLPVMDASHG